jgi:hypothetical protein
LDHFLSTFWTTFGAILGTILGPDRPKKGPRWAQEGHQELERPKILHLQKPSKTIGFSRFLGSRGLPREAPEAHEGSQEAPKELQDLKNKGSKNEPEKCQFLEQFWAHFGGNFGARMGSRIGSKLVLFLGPVFGPVFLDFEILVGRPAVARRSFPDTLFPGRSLGPPRAQYYLPITRHPSTYHLPSIQRI